MSFTHDEDPFDFGVKISIEAQKFDDLFDGFAPKPTVGKKSTPSVAINDNIDELFEFVKNSKMEGTHVRTASLDSHGISIDKVKSAPAPDSARTPKSFNMSSPNGFEADLEARTEEKADYDTEDYFYFAEERYGNGMNKYVGGEIFDFVTLQKDHVVGYSSIAQDHHEFDLTDFVDNHTPKGVKPDEDRTPKTPVDAMDFPVQKGKEPKWFGTKTSDASPLPKADLSKKTLRERVESALNVGDSKIPARKPTFSDRMSSNSPKASLSDRIRKAFTK